MIRVNLAVAVVMMVVAGFFTVNAVLAVILLKMVSYKMIRYKDHRQRACVMVFNFQSAYFVTTLVLLL